MVGTMVKQLTKNATIEEIEKSGLAPYYSDHDKAVYPVSASGVPFTAAYIQSKGDPITDLTEDMAAEQKARSTYEYLINLADDPDVIEPLKFLREREVVHFQRFGEALRRVQDYLAEKRVFTMPDMSRVQGIRYTPNAQVSPFAQNAPNARVSPFAQNAPDIQTMPSVRDSNIPAPNMPSNVQGVPDMPNMNNRYDNKYENKYESKYESKYENRYDNKYRR